MDLQVEQVEVWAASIQDKPGGLAGVLATLRDVGADLQLIIARRSPDRPGAGVVFVTPLEGDREKVAAAMAGSMSRKSSTAFAFSAAIGGVSRPHFAGSSRKLESASVASRGQ